MNPATGGYRPDWPAAVGRFSSRTTIYPDLDDTAVVAWAMHQAHDAARYAESVRRALDWLVGMQSRGRRVCGIRCGQYLLLPEQNSVRGSWRAVGSAHERRHGAGRDSFGARRPAAGQAALDRAIAYLREQQGADGSWFGRWGTNYIYGTWSVLMAFAQAHVGAK